MTECIYASAGCSFKGQTEEHEKKDYKKHLKMVASQMAEFFHPSSPINQSIHQLNNLAKASRNLANSYGRQYFWKLNDFKAVWSRGVGEKAIKSHLICTSRTGYRFIFYAYLRGADLDRGCNCSVYARMVAGEYDDLLDWPYQHTITLTLLDQCLDIDQRDHISVDLHPQDAADPDALQKPEPGIENPTFGVGNFVSFEKLLEKDHYVVDDCLYILISVHN